MSHTLPMALGILVLLGLFAFPVIFPDDMKLWKMSAVFLVPIGWILFPYLDMSPVWRLTGLEWFGLLGAASMFGAFLWPVSFHRSSG